ncbi:hypothetical protein D3C78_1802590 [compost metagenome]
MPPAPNLLHRAELRGTWIGDAFVGQVVAITFRYQQLKLGIVPAQQFLQVHMRTEGPLGGIARGTVVVVTALYVTGCFAHVADDDVHPLLAKFGT